MNNANYIAICAHFIDRNMKMADRCIILERYKATHSAADMKEVLMKLLGEYKLFEVTGTVLALNEEGTVDPVAHFCSDADPEPDGKK